MYSDGSMFLSALASGTGFTSIVFGLFRWLNCKTDYKYLIGFAAALILLLLTFQKINKMNLLLGNSEGRQTTSAPITRKWRDSYSSKGRTTVLTMLCFQSGREVCVDVSESVWQSRREGESLTVVSAPGDNEFFHPTGVYLSEGNLDFDHALLIFEIIAAIFCLVKILFPGFPPFHKFGKSNNIKLSHVTEQTEE